MARIQKLGGYAWPIAVAAVLASISSWAPTTMARDLDLCSTLNTGGSANMSIYQTVGLCYDFCIGEYAYAIVNYQSCWCSDWEPAESTEVDMSECDTNCPGYPSEKCGGAKNRFGYIALGMNPSGTSTPAGASTKVDTPPPATTTVQETVTLAPTAPANDTPTPVAPTTPAVDKPASDIDTDDGSKTATSATSVVTSITTDNGGAIRTVTTTPAAATDPPSPNTTDSNSGGGSGLNTGQVVGIVVGVIGGVAAIAVALVCFVVARRKQNAQGTDKGKGRSDMGESHFGVLSPGSGPWRQSGPSAGSRLSEVDPRMDPFKPGLYARNSSHESFHTMRDEQDYSRPVHQPKVLRATNPDPDAADD